MTPYSGLGFFFTLALALLPAVIAGLRGKNLRVCGALVTASDDARTSARPGETSIRDSEVKRVGRDTLPHGPDADTGGYMAK